MIQTLDRSGSSRFSRPAPRTLAGGMALIGAAMLAIGVVLPWFSLFAGLQPISALGTPNGALLIVGAAGVAGLGLLALVGRTPWVRYVLTGLGILLTAFSAYLVVGLVSVYRQVSSDPLVVAQLGPGLGLILIGSLLVVATALVGD
jgi:hypothetical protein